MTRRMAEIAPNPQRYIEIGTTPIYLRLPLALEGGTVVDSLHLRGDGVQPEFGQTIRMVKRNPHPNGGPEWRQIHGTPNDTIPWDAVDGIEIVTRDTSGVEHHHIIPKNQLSLDQINPPETNLNPPQSEPLPTPQPAPEPLISLGKIKSTVAAVFGDIGKREDIQVRQARFEAEEAMKESEKEYNPKTRTEWLKTQIKRIWKHNWWKEAYTARERLHSILMKGEAEIPVEINSDLRRMVENEANKRIEAKLLGKSDAEKKKYMRDRGWNEAEGYFTDVHNEMREVVKDWREELKKLDDPATSASERDRITANNPLYKERLAWWATSDAIAQNIADGIAHIADEQKFAETVLVDQSSEFGKKLMNVTRGLWKGLDSNGQIGLTDAQAREEMAKLFSGQDFKDFLATTSLTAEQRQLLESGNYALSLLTDFKDMYSQVQAQGIHEAGIDRITYDLELTLGVAQYGPEGQLQATGAEARSKKTQELYKKLQHHEELKWEGKNAYEKTKDKIRHLFGKVPAASVKRADVTWSVAQDALQNEFAAGTVAAGITYIVTRSLPNTVLRAILPPIAGGAVAGIRAGVTEYQRLGKEHKELNLATALGETFPLTQQVAERKWKLFGAVSTKEVPTRTGELLKFQAHKRSMGEVIKGIEDAIYVQGVRKETLTDVDVEQAKQLLRYVIDTDARNRVADQTGVNLLKVSELQPNAPRPSYEAEKRRLDRLTAEAKVVLNRTFAENDTVKQVVLVPLQTTGPNHSFTDVLEELTILHQGGLQYEINATSDRYQTALGESAVTADQSIARLEQKFNRHRRTVAAKRGFVTGIASSGIILVSQEIMTDVAASIRTGHLTAAGPIAHLAGGGTAGTTVTQHVVGTTPSEQTITPTLSGNTHDLDLGGGHHLNAPQELHWTDNPDGTHNLVITHLVNDKASNVPVLQHVQFTSDGAPPASVFDQLQHTTGINLTGETAGKLTSIESVVSPDHIGQVTDQATHQVHRLAPMIPSGTHLVADGNNFDLVDDKTSSVVLNDMHFSNTGALEITDKLREEAKLHNIVLDNKLLESVQIKGTAENMGVFDKTAGEMGATHGARGPWGWLEEPIKDPTAGIERHNGATNFVKNIFRGYEENVVKSANVEAIKTPGMSDTVPFVDAAHTHVNYNLTQPNVVFKDLPSSLFSDQRITQLGKLVDDAVAQVKGGVQPEDLPNNLRIAYEVGYVGRVAHADEIEFLQTYLGGGMESRQLMQAVISQSVQSAGTPGSITIDPTQFASTIQVPVEQVVTTTFAPLEAPPLDFPAPLPRRPLEMSSPRRMIYEVPMNYYDYVSGESFLTGEQYRNRRSPRLNSVNAQSVDLNQNQEINWYLSQLSNEDKNNLQELLDQHSTPLADTVRTVVEIPAYREGPNIYTTLTQYLNQKNKSGNNLNPNSYEIVVYDNHPADVQADDTKNEVERFQHEHPEIKVIYLSKSYPTKQSIGRIRRDLSNFVFKRMENRPQNAPDVVILSNDGDLVSIPPTYIADYLEKFDQDKSVDAVAGKWDFPEEAYSKFKTLFASQRAWQFLDAIIKHREMAGSPQLTGANSAFRASVLAAIGGYNPSSVLGEDLEVGWMMRAARNYNPKSIIYNNRSSVVTDPRRAIYKWLQGQGIVDRYSDFSTNEAVRHQSWQDLAQLAQDNFSRDKLEDDLTKIYFNLYGWLRRHNQSQFDQYFNRAMNMLGVQYEIKDDRVVILDDTKLREGLARHNA